MLISQFVRFRTCLLYLTSNRALLISLHSIDEEVKLACSEERADVREKWDAVGKRIILKSTPFLVRCVRIEV